MKFKHFTSVLLAIVLIIGLAVPAMADAVLPEQEVSTEKWETVVLEDEPERILPNVAALEMAALAETTHTVTTTVRLNGEPVEGVRVELDHIDSYWYEYTYSDSDGGIAFTDVPEGDFYLYIEGTDTYIHYEVSFSLPGQVPEINLEQAYSVFTRVTLNGTPVSGVNVRIYQEIDDFTTEGYNSAGAYSDEDGFVTFTGLPAGDQFYFGVSGSSRYLSYSGNFFTIHGHTYAPNIVLDPGESVSTIVTFEGVPQKNLYVKLMRGGSIVADTHTDDNGVAVFAVNTGYFTSTSPYSRKRYIAIDADDSAEYCDYRSDLDGKSFSIHPPYLPNIELKRGVTVKTKVTYNGDSQSYTYVTLKYQDNDYEKTVLTDYDGFATFYVPAYNKCYFTVEREEGKYCEFDGLAKNEVFSTSGTIPNVVLETGHTISTKATYNGIAQKNTRVILNNGRLAESIVATTDGNGVATFTNIAEANDYYFRVYADDTSPFASYWGDLLGKIFVVPGAAIPNIVLEKGNTVSTTVYLRGVPQSNIEVDLLHPDPLSDIRSYILDTVITDSNGIATFKNIPAGSKYYFVIWDTDYYGDELNHFFAVPGGAVPSIELDPTYKPGGSTSPGNSKKKSGGGGGGGGSFAAPIAPVVTAPALMPLDVAAATALAQKAATAGTAAKAKNVSTVSLAAMQAMAKILANSKLINDTMDGARVDVRIIIEPSKATKDVNISGSTISVQAKAVKAKFDKWFGANTLAINLGQKDSFGTAVEIVTKMDAKLGTGPLYFYAYNAEKNTYSQFTPKYWLDSAGYLHFTTNLAGNIVITNSPLKK